MTLQYGPLWSLAVEEHFYLLWPAAVRNLQRRTWIGIAVFIILATPVLRWLGYVHAGRPAGWVSLYTWCNLDGLALGALLAISVRASNFRREYLARVAFPLLLIGFAGCVCRPSVAAIALLLSSACNIAALGLISCALLIGTTERKALVDRPVLRFFGWLSYGLYLVHVFAFYVIDIAFGRGWSLLRQSNNPVVAMLLRFALGSALAIALAFLSRRSLETKFLAIGAPYRSRPDTPGESPSAKARHHALAEK